MKIRSPNEMNERLSAELAWRKRELTSFRQLIGQEPTSPILPLMRRAAVLLLYAHWEGYVKCCADAYLELVSRQRLPYRDLKTNFVAIACRGAIKESIASNASHLLTQVVDFIVLNAAESSRIPHEAIVDTGSNLSSTVLREIFHLIGIPYSPEFEAKGLLIDGSLLASRNRIAHGEWEEIDNDKYDRLHEFVIAGMGHFRDLVENAAVLKSFRRN